MITKGIRGATTIDNNTEQSIKDATIELLSLMVEKNNLEVENISHVIFSTTSDINDSYPAKYARIDLKWNKTAMMCLQEMNVSNSIKMCLRVLIVYNCSDDFYPEFVYLKGAKNLRKL